ncbi:helix-turn-helix transcriptional regulator [Modestobacter versicolor]|uniref:helix-turn-helix transcriptional regulator n=1 Tax=Modestobacter versicolor TaxID=429133 RepID=UPI0034DE16FA
MTEQSGPGVEDIIGQTEQLLASLRDVAGHPMVGLDTMSVQDIDDLGAQAATDATSSVVVLATAALSSIESTPAIFEALCAAARMRRRVRLLIGPHDLTDPLSRARIDTLVQAGAVVRVAPQAHSVMVLVTDNDLALLRPLSSGAPGMVVRARPLVTNLIGMADVLLRQGRDARLLPPLDGACGCLTTAQRRQILSSLALGEKDEVAARTLQVSLRTYRRYVAVLLEELGATSRFQAGVFAAERGWLDFFHQPGGQRLEGGALGPPTGRRAHPARPLGAAAPARKPSTAAR